MIKFYALSLCLLAGSFMMAQDDCAPDPYVLYYGDDGNAQGFTLLEANGDLFAGGSTNDDLLIMKVRPNGSIDWQTRLPVFGSFVRASDLIMDSDGHLVGLGRTGSTNSDIRAYIFKLDASTGQSIWFRELAAPNLAVSGFGVIEYSPGSPYTIVGNSYNNPGGQGCDASFFTVDRDTGDLDPLFNNQFHLGSCESFYSVIRVGVNYYATGRFNFAGGGQNRFRPAITAIDPSGQPVFSRLYLVDVNTDARLYATDIVQQGSNLAISIYGDPDGTDLSTPFVWLLQANAVGTAMWAKRYQLPELAFTQELVALSDGYLLSAISRESDTQYLLRSDLSGQLMWAKAYPLHTAGSFQGVNMIADDSSITLIGTTNNGNDNLTILKLDANGEPAIDCFPSENIDVIETNVTSPYDGFHALSIDDNPATPGANMTSETAAVALLDPSCPAVCEPDDCDDQPDPVVDLGDDITLCTGDSLTLDAGPGFANYLWQDSSTLQTFTVTMDGLYTVMVTDTCGRSAQDSIQVEFADVMGGLDSMGLCAGDTLIFGGSQITQAGTYFATDSSGTCPSMDTLIVFELPDFATQEMAQICSGDSINIFGQIQTMAGDYSAVFTATNGCDSTHTVSLSVVDDIQTSEAIAICFGDSVSVFGMPVGSSGIFTETGQSSAGCDSTHTVTVFALPPRMGEEDISICEGESVDIFGESQTEAGTYTATFTAANTCDSIHTVNLIVNPLQQTQEALAICFGDSVMLFGQNVGASGIYTGTAPDVNGCDSTHTVTLFALPPRMGEEDVSICAGESIDIFGNLQTEAGTYTATFTAANTCDSIHTINLSVLPVANTDETISICEGQSVDIFGNEVSQPGVFTQTFTGANGCDSTHVVTVEVTPTMVTNETITICPGESAIIFGVEQTEPGFYFNQSSSDDGCPITQVVRLIVTDLDLQVLQAFEQCTGTKVGAAAAIVDGGTEPYSYLWSNGATTQIIADVFPGVYSVTVTDANGCEASGSVEVVVHP